MKELLRFRDLGLGEMTNHTTIIVNMLEWNYAVRRAMLYLNMCISEDCFHFTRQGI